MGKRKNTRASSSRAHATSVASISTERQISRETRIKEIKNISRNLDSTENLTTAERGPHGG